MTKKHAITTAIALVAAILFTMSGILDTLLVFLLVGAIPGTTFSIPPLVMLCIVAGAIIVFMKWAASRQLYPGSPKVKASQDKVLRRTARRTVRANSKKRQAPNAEPLQAVEA